MELEDKIRVDTGTNPVTVMVGDSEVHAAAAPDLYEALENLLDHADSKDGDMNLLHALRSDARKALAKARGES